RAHRRHDALGRGSRRRRAARGRPPRRAWTRPHASAALARSARAPVPPHLRRPAWPGAQQTRRPGHAVGRSLPLRRRLLLEPDGALGLDRFALLGHSFGAIVATEHAMEIGTAAGYVIAGGGDSSAGLESDVAASLAAYGEGAERIAASWEAEKAVATDEEFRAILRDQLPFHFQGAPPEGFGEATIPAPEVLRHFASPR